MTHRTTRPGLRAALLLLPLLAALALFAPARRLAAQPAQPGPSAAPTAAPSAAPDAGAAVDAGLAADGGAPPPADSESAPADVTLLRDTAAQVRALLAGELDLSVDPATLFDVDLGDERALAVEVERLRRVVAEAKQTATEVDGGVDAAVADGGRPASDVLDGGLLDGGLPDGGLLEAGVADPDLDPVLLAARIELDEARLAFYELPLARRAELLDQHEERQRKNQDAQAKKDLSDAERERLHAGAEREKALLEAQRARSEAERAVAEERARLHGIEESHASLDATLITSKQQLKDLLEKLTEARLRADRVIAAPPSERLSPVQVDPIYDDIAAQVDRSREELEAAVTTLGSSESPIPLVGEERLVGLAVDVDRKDVDQLRAKVLEHERALLARVDTQRWDRARQLWQVLKELDQRRLGLLPFVSSDKHDDLTGFGPTGLAQARDELAQVSLIMRYHLRETVRFVKRIRETGEAGDSAFVATVTALKWLIPIALLVWWRRRAPKLLERWGEAAREAARKARRRADESLALRAIGVLKRVRSPLEWLLLTWAVVALLPRGAGALLEIELLSTALSWLFGGWLVVVGIDALADEGRRSRKSQMQTAELRLRSLRLIGRVIVAVGLVLALTSKLVGKGTIYSWVFSTCWWAAIPITLVIVRWWRAVIFARVELQRKKGPFLHWVEGHQTGGMSFVAAISGGGYLLGHGSWRVARGYVAGFDVTKRLLAYWFRREVAKQQAERKSVVAQVDAKLDDGVFTALGPEREPDKLVPSVADAQVEDVIKRIKEPGGSVFALVGERGAGKSTMLARIHDKTPDTALIRCDPAGMKSFLAKLCTALEVEEGTEFDAISGLLNKRAGDNALLVDDAQYLVRPEVDGFEEIDRLLGLARSSSVSCTWVFAFDSVLWQLFQRARETRPLFDDIIRLTPWSEDGIVRLLESRSQAVDVEPDFRRIMGELPEDADEVDVEDALERARSGYYRLIWDFSAGNPAVALHTWRASLRVDHEGTYVVQLFEPPDASDLERLPDSTVFVLRSLVQFGRATVADLVGATTLDTSQVEDALRYAAGRQYVEEDPPHYYVRWTWFRTITRFLVRRHLLMGPSQ